MCSCTHDGSPRRKHNSSCISERNLIMLPLLFVHMIKITDSSNPASGSRSIFSPRMQYDEWTPLGRGDPLKNDPTFDYVPPVLERVHYWVPPAARTPDPPRSSSPAQSSAASTTPIMQDRSQDVGVTKLRQAYVPVYYQYRATSHQRPPYTILVPPPPGDPHNYPPQSSISITQTSTSATTEAMWETQLATIAPTTQSQYNQPPPPDVTPSPSVLHFLLHGELAAPSTLPPPPSKQTPVAQPTKTTVANPSLTTDPLFSHYKQPAEPLRGPMYLIIQGHSKVKTYGPSKIDKISGIPIQETNEVSDDDFQTR